MFGIGFPKYGAGCDQTSGFGGELFAAIVEVAGWQRIVGEFRDCGKLGQSLGSKAGWMTTADTTAAKARMKRILDAMKTEKPVKRKRIELNYTLKEEAHSWTVSGKRFTVTMPIWFSVRGKSLDWPEIITDWLHDTRLIFDPMHGEDAKEECLSKWEDVMTRREIWQSRDREPTCQIIFNLIPWECRQLDAVCSFLRISREVFFVAVLCEAAWRLNGSPTHRRRFL